MRDNENTRNAFKKDEGQWKHSYAFKKDEGQWKHLYAFKKDEGQWKHLYAFTLLHQLIKTP